MEESCKPFQVRSHRGIDQRLLRQMKKMQYVIDDTVLFKQCLPCQCTEQEIHPHRENKDQYDKTRLIHILF